MNMQYNIKLDRNFTATFNRLRAKYGEELSKLNGMSDTQLSHTDFIDKFASTTVVADSSIDGSANVCHHDIVSMMNELPKPDKKLLAFNKIFIEMTKKYGLAEAEKWAEYEWVGRLYLHDFCTSSFIHYCFAYDLKDLAEKGLYFMDDADTYPAKHLCTFVDFVKEFISFAANRSSGAVGLPNLIPYMYYFWSRDVKNGYYTETPEKYAKQNIQRFVFAVNQPYVRDGIQSAFTNCSIFDKEYLTSLFGGAVFPDGAFMIDELDGITQFQKWFFEEVSETRSKKMMTYPVLSISLLRKDGKFADEEFAKWAVRHNMKWSDSNLFIDSSVTSLSNCCRLKSDIKDLGYFNSIGATALKVGSVKVNTVNLARIALESDSEEEYLGKLADTVKLDLEVLDCVRHIIKRNVEKGLLPNFTKGLVDFEHLYNTVGFLGVYETMKKFGYTFEDEFGDTFYTDKADEFGKKIFDTIHKTKDEFASHVDYSVNCEQVQGETAASVLMRKDKIFFGDKVIDDLPLYGNQFIPLGVKTTLKERVRIASLFDCFCNGGSILHINIDAPFKTFDSAWEAVNYVADAGVTYFAFNTKIQACKNNHGFYGKICPICGNPVDTEYSRIVG